MTVGVAPGSKVKATTCMTRAPARNKPATVDIDRSRTGTVSVARFDDKSPAVVEAVEAGASIEDAARAADVPAATVRRWLRDGRKGKAGYVEFAEAVDGLRGDRREAERALKGPLSPEEAALLLAKAARKGSVPALRLWYERKAAEAAGERGATARKLLAGVFGGD